MEKRRGGAGGGEEMEENVFCQQVLIPYFIEIFFSLEMLLKIVNFYFSTGQRVSMEERITIHIHNTQITHFKRIKNEISLTIKLLRIIFSMI